MKQLLNILFTVLVSAHLAFAQSPEKINSFRSSVLPKYSQYFSQAELTENGQLKLTAVDKYMMLTAELKKAAMVNIINAWQDSLVIVQSGTKSELWGRSTSTGNAALLDEWDLAGPQTPLLPQAQTQKIVMHPWFFYLGGQMMFDSQKTINISFNSRLGFFLLLNRWDLATTISAGVTGNADAAGTPYSNIGLMSRVHFPIKEYGITPNIGGEVTLASYGTGTPTFTPSLVLGVSWYVGFGRLDIGLKIGDITSGVGGFTIFPGAGKFK